MINVIFGIVLFICAVFVGGGIEREYHKNELDRRMLHLRKMQYDKNTGKLILIQKDDTLVGKFTIYDYQYLRTGSMKMENEK